MSPKRLCVPLVALLLVLVASCGDDGEGRTALSGFEEFAWQGREPDVRSERLCEEATAPDDAADTTFIHCQVEGDTFAFEAPPPREEIVVWAYNIERGFGLDRQLELLRTDSRVPRPDVLLLSEADRGCGRTDFRNVAREYARAFGFYYVYATEFVELPSDRGATGPYDPPLCEHGNAIVSRWPLGNVRQIRHAAQHDWYTPPGHPNPDEPRLGGRVAIAADMRVGNDLIRLYVLHLESTLSSIDRRDAQAVEIAEDALATEHPVIVGGDLNSFFYRTDLQLHTMIDGAAQAFLTRGFNDTHIAIPIPDRVTSYDDGFALVIDLLFTRGLNIHDAQVCPLSVCEGLSDHLPIWSVMSISD